MAGCGCPPGADKGRLSALAERAALQREEQQPLQELEEEVSYSSSSEGSCSTELPNRSMGQLTSLFERAAPPAERSSCPHMR